MTMMNDSRTNHGCCSSNAQIENKIIRKMKKTGRNTDGCWSVGTNEANLL